MSERNHDAPIGDRLRAMEGRLRAVERGRAIASEISTEAVILTTRDGTAKYRIQAGTNPGTVEIFALGGTVRRVIAVP